MELGALRGEGGRAHSPAVRLQEIKPQFSSVRITDLEIGFPTGNGIRRLTDDSCQIRGAQRIDAQFPSAQGP